MMADTSGSNATQRRTRRSFVVALAARTVAAGSAALVSCRSDASDRVDRIALPSHGTLLTGLAPHHHGARANVIFSLPDRVKTLAETLKARGYRTAAMLSAFVLDRRFGLAQGFETYADDLTADGRTQAFGYRERLDSAREHLEQVIKSAPDSSAAYYNLGVVLARQRRLADAGRTFGQAVRLDPKNASAHNALGQVLLELGRRDEAIAHFREALAIAPDSESARANLRRAETQPAR